MKKAFIAKIKEELINQKNNIIKQHVKEVDVDMDGDETDEIQANILIQLNNQLQKRNASKLLQIEKALTAIENKTYGSCVDCEEAIAEKRLLHNPHFQTCVLCAEDRENEEKQRKRL